MHGPLVGQQSSKLPYVGSNPTVPTNHMNNNAIVKLALEVSKCVQELIRTKTEVAKAYELQMSEDCQSDDWDFQYAEAIYRWRCDGNPRGYFSTASPLLLACKQELKTRFGLEVVDPKTGLKREKSEPTMKVVVDGWGTGHKATQRDLDSQYKQDRMFFKNIRQKNHFN